MKRPLIRKAANPELAAPVLREADNLANAIAKRAFEIFLARIDGRTQELQDWLQAERELLSSTPAELVENDREYRLSVAVPGFDPPDIEVTVLPDAIIVRAIAANTNALSAGRVLFSEMGSRSVLRRIDLPERIDVDRTTASLDKAIVRLWAQKAVPVGEPKLAARAQTVG